MSKPRPIYRTDGTWMAAVHEGNLFDTHGEWVGWLDGADVYSLDGDYVGFISEDGRLLRKRILPYTRRRRPPTRKPTYKPPHSIPLPPMFAELSYSYIDVLEEKPDTFALIHELRPDYGEGSLLRLVEADPRLAVQEKLRKVEQNLLEEMVYGIVYSYRVAGPPVPIEAMAAGLQPENARNAKEASPLERLQLAEGMIERLGHSTWAVERSYCGPEGLTWAQVEYAARALLLPRHWILKARSRLLNPQELARQYVVPEETAILRLHDLE